MPEAGSLRRTKRKTEGVLTESGCVPKKLAGLEGKDLEVRQTAAVWPLFIQPPVLIHDGGGAAVVAYSSVTAPVWTDKTLQTVTVPSSLFLFL